MAHFIKTAEDLYEALVNSVPNIQFGLGFCESSGPCLVRREGNDVELRRMAAEKALEIGCGHSFLIYLRNAYPLNVLDKIKKVPEVCTVYAATANRFASPRRRNRPGKRHNRGCRRTKKQRHRIRRGHCLSGGISAENRLQTLRRYSSSATMPLNRYGSMFPPLMTTATVFPRTNPCSP